MQSAARLLVALVAAIHVYILVLEMFLWETPTGRRAFGLSPEKAKTTKVLAANQGLYNGFLAAGLLWGLQRGADGIDVQVFFGQGRAERVEAQVHPRVVARHRSAIFARHHRDSPRSESSGS